MTYGDDKFDNLQFVVDTFVKFFELSSHLINHWQSLGNNNGLNVTLVSNQSMKQQF